MKRGVVTIRDVVRLIGAGIFTASQALNNKGEISAMTKKRVLEVAKHLRCVPIR